MASTAVRSEAVVLLLLIHYLLLLQIVCGDFVFGPCFAVYYLVSFLVLQSSRWGREGWLQLIACGFYCYVSLPQGAVIGLQCVIVALPYSHLLFDIGAFVELCYKCNNTHMYFWARLQSIATTTEITLVFYPA